MVSNNKHNQLNDKYLTRIKNIVLTKYILFDIISSLLAWLIFFSFRKIEIENYQLNQIFDSIFKNPTLYIGLVLIPIYWLLLSFISGFYRYVLRKRLVSCVGETFKITLVGTLILFFTLLLDDQVRNYKNYYYTLSVLFSIQFVFSLTPRYIIGYIVRNKIKKGKINFNTVIIGSSRNANLIYEDLLRKKNFYGNNFIGYLKVSEIEDFLHDKLEYLGTLHDLPDLINKFGIKEIIIAIEPEEEEHISNIVSWIGYSEVLIKSVPDLGKSLKGKSHFVNILSIPLIEVQYELMPVWQQALKIIIDKTVAFLAVILLSPVFLICFLGIKLTSRGPIFFKQERIGKNGKPFVLYKFRSMYIDAEKNGPNLSIKDDPRITPFGRFLRKTKLDEIPNFINVLKGDMSLVGPRPERQYYIDQIVKICPTYKQLQKIKPGVTSLGQVRYGYASSVDEMISRMKFDLLYMQNMSLSFDFLIIYYTIIILFRGRHI